MGSGSAGQSQDEEMDNSAVSEGSTKGYWVPNETQVPLPKEKSCLEEKLKGIVRKHSMKEREWCKRWTRAKL